MAVSNTKSSRNRRFALIVANSKYDDPDLQNLAAAGQDAKALSSVLKNADIGGFEVKILENEPTYKVNEEIETFFGDRYRDDLLLLYFSCHGIKDVDGRLYYASINTRRKLLASTAISANFVNDVMLRSRSRSQMLVIDCCYGGAFSKGMLHKADKQVHTGDQFEGRGRIVLTASDAIQYSFEGDRREGVGERSVFTHALVQGLESGEADIDKNGLVSYAELYNYAYDHVLDETPMQKPGMWVFGLEGDVVVAKNPYKRKTQEQDPNDLIQDAYENLKKGDYDSTIEYSDKAIKVNPHFAFAYNIKGLAYFNLRRYYEALVCYEKALELRPKYIEALNNKGLVLAAIGDNNKAIQCFSQSTDLSPNDAVVWNYKGLAFHALGKYEDALGSFDRAISLNPTYTEALNNREFSSQLKKKDEEHQPQPQQNVTESGTSSNIGGIFQSSSSKGSSKIKQDYTGSESAAPIGTHSRTVRPPSSNTTEENIRSDISKTKGAVYSTPVDDDKHIYTIEQESSSFSSSQQPVQKKKSGLSNPTILLPILGGVIGAIIVALIAGGIIHLPGGGGGNAPATPPAVTPITPINNHPPTATGQFVTTNKNTPVNIILAGSDPNPNATLTAHIISPPLHGKLSDINQDTGIVTYSPNSGFAGTDKFTFKVNDGKVDSSNTGTANVKVNGVGPITSVNTNRTTASPLVSSTSLPTSTNQFVTTNKNTPVNIILAGSDPNPNATLTAHIISPPLHGKLSDINQDTGIVTYSPNSGFAGTDKFTFKVNDGKVDSSNTGTANVKVGAA